MQPTSAHRRGSRLTLAAWASLWLSAGSIGIERANAAAPDGALQRGAAALPAPSNAASTQQSGAVWLTTSSAGELARYRQIARAADGSYVGVRDNRTAGQGSGDNTVFVRRFDPSGNPVGAEAAVARGFAPGLASFADGTFLVTWLVPPPATFSLTVAVSGQLFDAAGTALAPPLTLGVTAGSATPSALSDGTFVLATFGNFSRVNGPSGFVRSYTRTGDAAGLEAPLHEDACGIDGPPAVAALAAGGFAVAWPYACASAPQVRMRVYGASNTASAASRLTVGRQGDRATVSLAPLANGNLALAWTLGPQGAMRELHTLVVAPAALPPSAAGATSVPLQPGRTPGPVQSLPEGGFVIPWLAASDGDARAPVSRFSNTGEPL